MDDDGKFPLTTNTLSPVFNGVQRLLDWVASPFVALGE